MNNKIKNIYYVHNIYDENQRLILTEDNYGSKKEIQYIDNETIIEIDENNNKFIKKFNNDGNLLYIKYENDVNDKEKFKTLYLEYYDYDENGNNIYVIYNGEYQVWKKYDKNNRITEIQSSYNNIETYIEKIYYKSDKEIYSIDSKGNIKITKYNENNDMIYYYETNSKEIIIDYIYDKNIKIAKYNNGVIEITLYNDYNNEIYIIKLYFYTVKYMI